MSPLVSIVTTVAPTASLMWLEEAIQSLIEQTFDGWELVLWFDGPHLELREVGGNTAAAHEGWASRFDQPRIHCVLGERVGRVMSLINATAASDSPYTGLLDADDLLAPSALMRTAAVLDQIADAPFVYTAHQKIGTFGEDIGLPIVTPYEPDLLLKHFYTHHFRLVRRAAYDAVGGFNQEYPVSMDTDLCLKLEELGRPQFISQVLYYYRSHTGQISALEKVRQIKYGRRSRAVARKRRKRWTAFAGASL